MIKLFQNGSTLVAIISGPERVKRLSMAPEGSRLEIFPASYYSSLTTQAAHLQPVVLGDEEMALIEAELSEIFISSILDCVNDNALRIELIQTVKQKLVGMRAKNSPFEIKELDVSELAKEIKALEESMSLEREVDAIKLNALKSIKDVIA